MDGIGKRIKLARTQLEMTQADFANRLGIGQAALSSIEKGNRNVTDRNINLICSEFNVNEEWLRTGDGKMFAEHKDVTKEIVDIYLSLNPEQRKAVESFAKFLQSGSGLQITHIHPVAENDAAEDISNLKIEIADELNIEREVEAYRKELLAEKKGKMSQASGDTKDAV